MVQPVENSTSSGSGPDQNFFLFFFLIFDMDVYYAYWMLSLPLSSNKATDTPRNCKIEHCELMPFTPKTTGD